jgi:hypothetical protein
MPSSRESESSSAAEPISVSSPFARCTAARPLPGTRRSPAPCARSASDRRAARCCSPERAAPLTSRTGRVRSPDGAAGAKVTAAGGAAAARPAPLAGDRGDRDLPGTGSRRDAHCIPIPFDSCSKRLGRFCRSGRGPQVARLAHQADEPVVRRHLGARRSPVGNRSVTACPDASTAPAALNFDDRSIHRLPSLRLRHFDHLEDQ